MYACTTSVFVHAYMCVYAVSVRTAAAASSSNVSAGRRVRPSSITGASCTKCQPISDR